MGCIIQTFFVLAGSDCMYEVQSLHKKNIGIIEDAYNNFTQKAMTDYRWTEQPVDFTTLIKAFEANFLKGLALFDSGDDKPIGFMLYVYEEHRSVEINLIHIEEPDNWQTMLDVLMRGFLAEIKNRPGWDCVSYPLLGIQSRFVLTLPWYGFKPVGQAIEKFDFTNELCLPVLGRQNETMPAVDEAYQLITWDSANFKPKYKDDAAVAIAKSFEKSNDTKWDPRFRSVEGAKKALLAMQDGRMGRFLPECTSLLIHKETDTAVGFCFLVQSDVTVANIPLIGVIPDHKGKKLGNQLLKHTLMSAVKKIIDGDMLLTEINATVDTDNFFALKMYRRMGFQELYNYPHCYLDAETASLSYFGKEAFAGQKSGCCSNKDKTPVKTF